MRILPGKQSWLNRLFVSSTIQAGRRVETNKRLFRSSRRSMITPLVGFLRRFLRSLRFSKISKKTQKFQIARFSKYFLYNYYQFPIIIETIKNRNMQKGSIASSSFFGGTIWLIWREQIMQVIQPQERDIKSCIIFGKKKKISWKKLARQKGLRMYPNREMPWKQLMLTPSSFRLVIWIKVPRVRKKMTVLKITSDWSPFSRARQVAIAKKNSRGPCKSY